MLYCVRHKKYFLSICKLKNHKIHNYFSILCKKSHIKIFKNYSIIIIDMNLNHIILIIMLQLLQLWILVKTIWL